MDEDELDEITWGPIRREEERLERMFYKFKDETPVHLSTSDEGIFRAIFSIFIPGLGQLLKGQVIKGVLIFLSVQFAPLLIVAPAVMIYGLDTVTTSRWILMAIIPSIVIWLWQIRDAYQKKGAKNK